MIRQIEGEDIVQKVQLKNVRTNQESTLDLDAVFVFVGTSPSTEFLNGAVKAVCTQADENKRKALFKKRQS